MNKKEIKKITSVAKKLEWVFTISGTDITFSKFSPAGQDFNIEISAENIEELVEEIKERANNYDCSQEAYYWLDNSGHGINGAPDDMKDVYEDIETCKKMMEELYEELCNLL